MRGVASLVVVLGLAACQPSPGPFLVPGCATDAPAAGEVVYGSVDCADQEIAGGEGRTADYRMANDVVRAVIRHPAQSLTLVGLGGGTVIDAAPWGRTDPLHEVAPIVGGGWLDVDSFDVSDDGITVGGTVDDLPDRPADAPGERREITWRLDPGSPWIAADGAEGLWVHVDGDFELHAGQLWSSDTVVATDVADPADVDDLGGAIRANGATRLLVEPTSDAVSWLPGSTVPLSGTATDASRVVLYAGSDVFGWVKVGDDGLFDVTVPPEVTAVRAEASGRAPSATVAVGQDLVLELGASGTADVALDWGDDEPRPVAARWSDRTGRDGAVLLSPDGGTLSLGAGAFDLTVDGGPDVLARSLRLQIGDDAEDDVGVSMGTSFHPGRRVLAAIPWYGTRSTTWRGSDAVALRTAIADGIRYAVVAPDNDVASASPAREDQAWILAENGVTGRSDDGWSIVAWPEGANKSLAGHGAQDVRKKTPEEALALMRASYVAVDVPWLRAVTTPPWDLRPLPGFVRLDSPGDDVAAAWGPWFDWLDQGVALAPLGPRTWVDVADPDVVGDADVEDGLVRGRVTATTGPVIALHVGDAGPGDARDLPTSPRVPVTLDVAGPAGSIDTVEVWGERGRVGTFAVDALPWHATPRIANPGHWVVAVARSSTGDDWAVSGPVWLDPPGSEEP